MNSIIELGTIKRAREIGKGSCHYKYIWHACEVCGKERWVLAIRGQAKSKLCHSCANSIGAKSRIGKKSNHWKGGEFKFRGYIFVRKPEHPKANRGYVKRAILVLEEKLGRPLLPGMDSHHKNDIKDDDRPENLEELPHATHSRETWRRHNNG